MASLEEIRQKLRDMESRKGGRSQAQGASLTYPFWHIPEEKPATLRLLPDANSDNQLFWRERQIVNLDFPGVKGDDESKRVVVKVPCVEMWGDPCPIHAEIRPWWNDKSLEDQARKYWKKRSYLFQGFVRNDPMNEDEKPENPIRRFIVGRQIFNIIKATLLSAEMESSPVDYLNGRDFNITRTRKGEYSDYSTSSWSWKESSLTEEELEAIEKFHLFDLNDWLPAKPTPEALNAIQEMFEASVEGELYDPSRWAKYYRPYGLEYDGVSNDSSDKDDGDDHSEETHSAPKAEAKETSSVEVKKADDSAAKSSPTSAEAIIAKIRSRTNAS